MSPPSHAPRIPVRIDRGGDPSSLGFGEQGRQLLRQLRLQEEGADVHVSACAQADRGPTSGAAQPTDRAGEGGQHRTVVACGQDDRDAGGPLLIDGHPSDVDLARGQLIPHEPPEQIVPHHPHERDAQTEAGGAAGRDRARAADREPRVVHQPLRLAEGRDHVIAAQDEVGVRIAQHQQVEVRMGGSVRASGRRRSGTQLRCRRATDRAGEGRHHPPGRRRRRQRGQHLASPRRRRRRRDHQGGGAEALADRERVIDELGNPPLPTGRAVSTSGGALRRAGSSTRPGRSTRAGAAMRGNSPLPHRMSAHRR